MPSVCTQRIDKRELYQVGFYGSAAGITIPTCAATPCSWLIAILLEFSKRVLDVQVGGW